MKRFLILAGALLLAGCATTGQKIDKPYVVEVITFKLKPSVTAESFWKCDEGVEADYTSKQPGFINRESGYSGADGEVAVVVRWTTTAAADASMKKFMGDPSVQDFVGMIDATTMSMKRYEVK